MEYQALFVKTRGETLTRDVILSLRTGALRPDRSTRLRIRSLGCASHQRGSRGRKPKVKSQLPIPVVVGIRRPVTPSTQPKRQKEELVYSRQPVLIPVRRHVKHTREDDKNVEASVPSLYNNNNNNNNQIYRAPYAKLQRR